MISAPAIAFLYIVFGWKMTFVFIAGLGLIWVIPWLIINKATPDKHPWLTDKERNYILDIASKVENTTDEAPVLTWKELLKFRNTWGIITARFFIDPVWWLFVTWLPTFLKEQFMFDIKQIGAFTWLPYLFAAIGSLLGGYHSSWQVKKGINAVKARKNSVAVAVFLCWCLC
ncbi:MFS transporter [Pedobacter sp. NJ-S-72]